MPDLDPCQALRDADLAYFNLVTNRVIRVVVDQNGERIEYSTANIQSLLAYIRGLASRCPAYVPLALGTTACKPLGFVF